MTEDIEHNARFGGRFKDLSGSRFGRLLVVRPVSRKTFPSGKKHILYQCWCDCGSSPVVDCVMMRRGESTSCGCFQREATSLANRTHGLSQSHEYQTWKNIKNRCSNTSNKHYGGKGIRVCDRWLESFENFLSDMGTKPSKTYTIERKDNNIGYCPSNCIWASRDSQTRNTNRNIYVTIKGVTKCVSEWSRETGTKEATIYRRIHAGWDEVEAVLKPARIWRK